MRSELKKTKHVQTTHIIFCRKEAFIFFVNKNAFAFERYTQNIIWKFSEIRCYSSLTIISLKKNKIVRGHTYQIETYRVNFYFAYVTVSFGEIDAHWLQAYKHFFHHKNTFCFWLLHFFALASSQTRSFLLSRSQFLTAKKIIFHKK